MSKTQAPDPQAGYKLVPLDPTDAMAEAGGIALETSPAHDIIGPLMDAWAAMLAAAPALPAPEGALRAAAQRVLDDCIRISNGLDGSERHNGALAELRAALAAPAPQAPAALTVIQILDLMPESIPARHDGDLIAFASAAIAEFCRTNGIPAPQTKEPTHDR